MRSKQKFFFIFSTIIFVITLTFCLTYKKISYASGEIFKFQNQDVGITKVYLITNHKFSSGTKLTNAIINNEKITLKNISLVKKYDNNYIYNIKNWINTDYAKCNIILKNEIFFSYLIKKILN